MSHLHAKSCGNKNFPGTQVYEKRTKQLRCCGQQTATKPRAPLPVFFAKFPQNWLLGICRVRFGSCVTKQKLYPKS